MSDRLLTYQILSFVRDALDEKEYLVAMVRCFRRHDIAFEVAEHRLSFDPVSTLVSLSGEGKRWLRDFEAAYFKEVS